MAAPRLNSHLRYNARTVTGHLSICSDINIAIPWLLPDGRMITPIIPKAGPMSLNTLSTSVAQLSKRIEGTHIDELLYRLVLANTLQELRRVNFSVLPRILSSVFGSQKLPHLQGNAIRSYYSQPEHERLTEKDIMDATVTVSNIGSLYRDQKGQFGLLEVIPPQVFAVGISSIQEKPGVFLNALGEKEIGIRQFLPMCLAFDHRAFDFDTLIPFLRRLDGIFANLEEIETW